MYLGKKLSLNITVSALERYEVSVLREVQGRR